MKTSLLTFFLLNFLIIASFGQSPVKATIVLKDGKTLNVHHFGKLKCESNSYAATFTILRGQYSGNHTEINDYKGIEKLVLAGFTDPPISSKGNQKGTITVVKKNGVNVVLENAELAMSCFGPTDRYNEIHVQIINPLTDQAVDLAVEINKIATITFL
jgi:hypothetical protein